MQSDRQPRFSYLTALNRQIFVIPRFLLNQRFNQKDRVVAENTVLKPAKFRGKIGMRLKDCT